MYGGDLHEIAQQSLLEQYLKPTEEDRKSFVIKKFCFLIKNTI